MKIKILFLFVYLYCFNIAAQTPTIMYKYHINIGMDTTYFKGIPKEIYFSKSGKTMYIICNEKRYYIEKDSTIDLCNNFKITINDSFMLGSPISAKISYNGNIKSSFNVNYDMEDAICNCISKVTNESIVFYFKDSKKKEECKNPPDCIFK